MIGTSPLEYVWVVTWVIILHSIGPLCAIYCVMAIFLPEYLRVWRYFEYWAVIETVFYFITYGYRKYYLQHPALHPPPLVKEERSQLFRLCFGSSQDFATSFSRWFLDTPIVALKRENIKECSAARRVVQRSRSRSRSRLLESILCFFGRSRLRSRFNPIRKVISLMRFVGKRELFLVFSCS